MPYLKLSFVTNVKPFGRLPLTGEDLVRIALASVVIGLVFAIYEFLGHDMGKYAEGTELRVLGVNFENFGSPRSTFRWMIFRWFTAYRTYGQAYYFLAVMVPLMSLVVMWLRRDAIQQAAKRVNWLGWLVIAGSLLAHWAGVKTEHPRVCMLSLISLMWGIPFFLFGWKVARQLIFPCAYLVFLLPLNFLDALVYRLRVGVSHAAAFVLNGLGVECALNGTTILESGEGGFILQTQDAAAALGTLLLVSACAGVLANLSQRGWCRQWAVFLAAIPVFMVASVFVITFSGLMAGSFGQGLADWMTAHGLTALIMTVSLLGVVLTAVGMRRIPAIRQVRGPLVWQP